MTQMHIAPPVEFIPKLGFPVSVCHADVHLAAAGEDGRKVTLTGHGEWWAGAVIDLRDQQGLEGGK